MFLPRWPAARASSMRRLEDPVGPDILETKVDVGGARPGGEARDQDALEELVGVPLHQVAVVEGRRLALVGVDAHERFFPILGKKRPLQAAREAGAAAAAELGILDQVDDRVGRHGREGLAGRLVAAARFINLQRMAVGDVPVAAQDGFKRGHVSIPRWDIDLVSSHNSMHLAGLSLVGSARSRLKTSSFMSI